MPSIECAICSEEFGKHRDSFDLVTPCGHVFHEPCLRKWLEYSKPTKEPNSCPECRRSVVLQQTNRIYFNLSTHIDNVQEYVDNLNADVAARRNDLYVAKMLLDRQKNEWNCEVREKNEIIGKLNGKIDKLKSKLKIEKQKIEKLKEQFQSNHKHAPPYSKYNTVQINMSENMGMPTMYHPTEPPSAHLSTIRIPPSCDPSTQTIFSPSLSQMQTATSTSAAGTTTVQNPFECDLTTTANATSAAVAAAAAAINSNMRSMHHRNPLSPFTPSYQSQNGHIIGNQYGQTFSAMMNPMQSVHATQTTSQHHHQQQQQQQYQQQQQQQHQQSITYNQTNFFLPIQTTNAINAAYFSANEQSHFVGQ